MNEVLAQTCIMSHPRAGFILLRNPFEATNIYSPITHTINVNQSISRSVFEQIVKMYNITVDSQIESIVNNVGSGKVFNLPKSEIIIGNNISIELTSVQLELGNLKKNILIGSTSK